MARKGENIYKRKDGRWEARYEKGRNSKGQIIYGSLYGKSYREVREKKINSIIKTSCNKDHFAVRIHEYLRCQHQVAGINPAHGKRKHIQLLPDTDSKTHSYLF